MSKIKNGGLDQYGAEPFEQQQFGTAGVKGVKHVKQCTCGSSVMGSMGQGGLSSGRQESIKSFHLTIETEIVLLQTS